MIEVRIHIYKANASLLRAQRNLKTGKLKDPVYVPALSEISAEQKKIFAQQMGPVGKWQKVEKVSRRRPNPARKGKLRKPGAYRRLKPGTRILGRLNSAWKVVADEKHIAIFSRASWSGIHQRGGKVGNGAVLPERKSIYVTNGMLATVRKTFGACVVKEIEGT